ncbi:PEP-CTERM sorting domain-containing protein [Rubritalea spongiae]|uniref:PEP-CTERM sorting domain-containing protein n=1 Tax=Rubritalea spongiae TaxID=430797 RepID=A0ABW5E1R2_9BACT
MVEFEIYGARGGDGLDGNGGFGHFLTGSLTVPVNSSFTLRVGGRGGNAPIIGGGGGGMSGIFTSVSGSWQIIAGGGGGGGHYFDPSNVSGGIVAHGERPDGNGYIKLTYNTVPEPSSALLILLGSAAALCVRKRTKG